MHKEPQMDINTADTILKAAAVVRREVQNWASRMDNWAIDPDNLCGACGIASYLLHRTLSRLGIESKLVMGRFYDDGLDGRSPWQVESDLDDPTHCNHCWLVVDGYIVDITATQFGCPEEIFVTKAEDYHYLPIKTGKKATYDLLHDWDDQSPTSYPGPMKAILNQATMEARV